MVNFEGADGTKYFFSVSSVDCVTFDKADLLIWYRSENGKAEFIKIKTKSKKYAEEIFNEFIKSLF